MKGQLKARIFFNGGPLRIGGALEGWYFTMPWSPITETLSSTSPIQLGATTGTTRQRQREWAIAKCADPFEVYAPPLRAMKSSVASAQRSAWLAATWEELPGRTSRRELAICCCHPRVSL